MNKITDVMDNADKNTTIVFTTLAMNQTRFFAKVGAAMEQIGYQAAYLCFHERSVKYLQEVGLKAYNVYETTGSDTDRELDQYKIENITHLLSHERLAYGQRDTNSLLGKLEKYLSAVSSILVNLKQDGKRRLHVVQEYGGFIPLIATFYAARRHGVDNTFLEPSFFAERLFFVHNAFMPPSIADVGDATVSSEVSAYLSSTISSQRIVIPKKDARKYRSIYSKLIDPYNIRRLVEKLVDKHILGLQEEFCHIEGYVHLHLKMLINRHRMTRYYQHDIARLPPYVYFPLHVPNDASLTLRSPEYYDQFHLVDYLCRVMPRGLNVAIKEHPALIGANDFDRIRSLMRRYDNLHIVSPEINNYDVLRAAGGVVTINSKSGAEGLLLGKPVIVLGDAFYGDSGLAHKISKLADLPHVLRNIGSYAPSLEKVHQYFQKVWECSWPGELYELRDTNILNVASSLHMALTTSSSVDIFPKKNNTLHIFQERYG